MANPATKKRRTRAKRSVQVEQQHGDREAKRERDRQDATTKEADKAGANLEPVIGFDERTSDTESYLHPEDMLRLLLYQARVQQTILRQQSAKIELDNAELAYLKRQLEIGKRHSAAAHEHAATLGKLHRLHASIEGAYGIKLKTITFDDETGLIHDSKE